MGTATYSFPVSPTGGMRQNDQRPNDLNTPNTPRDFFEHEREFDAALQDVRNNWNNDISDSEQAAGVQPVTRSDIATDPVVSAEAERVTDKEEDPDAVAREAELEAARRLSGQLLNVGDRIQHYREWATTGGGPR